MAKRTGSLATAALLLGGWLAVAWLSQPAMAGVGGNVDRVDDDGRTIVIAGAKIAVSETRTIIFIDGIPAKRGALRSGMHCDADVTAGTAGRLRCTRPPPPGR